MPPEGVTAEFDPNLLASFDQRIVGRDYGSCPPIDFPRLVDLYHQGTLDLDAMDGALRTAIGRAVRAYRKELPELGVGGRAALLRKVGERHAAGRDDLAVQEPTSTTRPARAPAPGRPGACPRS